MSEFRNLIDPSDFSVDELYGLIADAQAIISSPDDFKHTADGKILASLFYEPSTRTKFSFDAAMLRLGGQVIGFSDPTTSSTAKGETIADSAKTVSQYADIIVVRHPKEGTAKLMSKYADCPVINAGDGGHQHPTQTLTDLLTIMNCKGRLDNLTVGVCGDLKFGRTIHSLVTCLSRFENIKFVFISPEELSMPGYVKETIAKRNIEFTETSDLESSIPKLDILYMSRVQRERFVSEEEYLRLKDVFILTADKMKLAKPDMIVMHPLPRVNEIATEVDSDPRAKYFEQVRYGMFIRMALIKKLLNL
ncbi:MAG: aspartate carbamoyltransferase [Eubacteriales bacterium]|nr:aspartate carbamoyltransferase [Eubacteriales bacterium]MCI7570688.1 aspartate carbamoyltransferase [Clostridiales bacterium]MDD7550502.1 aspartate carbamoyltransferase [Clostridia bacterium]MDY5754236.1 aspartate carbamoyltransferase [Eubacteriales bacterium]